jgi:cytochrome o ubiquinol oxidase subunit 3
MNVKSYIEEENEQVATERTLFGFWLYIMSDCLLFASLFATFIVLRNNTWGGPAGGDLFSLPFVLGETLILLTSSFVCGLAVLALYRGSKQWALAGLILTGLLGAAFIALEVSEFARFVHEGASWQRSGFLSAFFTLVGTHGLHVCAGLLWLIVLISAIWQRGINEITFRRTLLFSLFWHFLDIVWIFIFSIVYLMGLL